MYKFLIGKNYLFLEDIELRNVWNKHYLILPLFLQNKKVVKIKLFMF